MDTDEAMVVFDTVNRDFTTWLDAEIAERIGRTVLQAGPMDCRTAYSRSRWHLSSTSDAS